MRPHRRSSTRTRLAGRCAVAAVEGLAATAVAYALAVHTSVGRRVDDDVYGAALGQDTLRIGVLDRPIHAMNGGWLVVSALVLIGFGLIRRRPILGIAAALAAVIPPEVDQLVRYHLLNRSPFAVAMTLGNTFPSGHEIVVISLSMAAILIAPRPWRGGVAIVGFVLSAAVANQLQVIGWHRFADLVGAAFLAFALVAAITGLTVLVRPVAHIPNHPDPRGLQVLEAVGLAGAVVALLAFIVYGLAKGPWKVHAAYLLGIGSTVAVIALVLGALLLLLGDADLDTSVTTGASQPVS